MIVTLHFVGTPPGDLRFFIRADGRHAGGITLHSVCPPAFSYGIAIAPGMRRRHVASRALALLFDAMRARGFTEARVQIEPHNAASLALHRRLGFTQTVQSPHAVLMTRML